MRVEDEFAGPIKVSRRGKDLGCSHCSGNTFFERSALLNTRGMTWLGLDWLNEGAEVFSCATCGHLEWFVAVPGVSRTQPTAMSCLACGNLIPPETDRCLVCGWTYAADVVEKDS